LVLSRPIWELRCGMTTLGEKLAARANAQEVACFVLPYMANAYRAMTVWKVNDLATLSGDDLLVVDGRVKAAELEAIDKPAPGWSQIRLDADGEVLVARIAQADLPRLQTDSIQSLLDSAKRLLPVVSGTPHTWNYLWELVLANPRQLYEDFAQAKRSGIEGTVEQPNALRGDRANVYIARGAVVHPMVVVDTVGGPVYIDEGAEIQPFTRIAGPCYIGKKTILLRANCREGTSIGPMCRVGGEVEGSILHGYANKYHDGFLGHSYVGQWVNLGALTTNSDLKNDYSNIRVVLDGSTALETGANKIGAFIGDHVKTSIGTLLNTGAYVGAMSLIVGSGKLLPKFVPSFTWFLEDAASEGFGKARLYAAAATAMARRQFQWTPADESLWDEVFRITAPEREEAIARSRRRLGTQCA
jgi:UDP-N-acetylglucosamine diphosphorylase/glucosamine-1-phosphate N-acetyltransferase